jgi:hypothetical protein
LIFMAVRAALSLPRRSWPMLSRVTTKKRINYTDNI